MQCRAACRAGDALGGSVEPQLEHQLDGRRVRRPRFVRQGSPIRTGEPSDDARIGADDRVRLVAVPFVAGEEQALLHRGERAHRLESFALFKLRCRLERGHARPDRPLIDVIAARRLLAVLALRRPQRQQRRIGLEHRAGATR